MSDKAESGGEEPNIQSPLATPEPLAKRSPQAITILGYLHVILGGLALLIIPLLLFAGGITVPHIEGAAPISVTAAIALIVGLGLLYLKRWTVPLFVVWNVIGVVEHFVLNIPFTLANIVPLLILFYVMKYRDRFTEK